jgi:hypothetical protein
VSGLWWRTGIVILKVSWSGKLIWLCLPFRSSSLCLCFSESLTAAVFLSYFFLHSSGTADCSVTVFYFISIRSTSYFGSWLVTTLRAGRSEFDSRQGQGIFFSLFGTSSRTVSYPVRTGGSRHSSVGVALGYRLDDRGSRVRFPAGLGIFLFSTSYRTALGTRGSFPWG